jgi:hypothetical protein
MDPGKLIDSLIGKRPRVFMFFGDTVTPGIVEPFYDPDRRSELGVSEENSHSLAGLGLELEQQKTLAPGLYPHLILRTTELFAERDFTAITLMDKEFAIGETEWEHAHGFASQRIIRRMARRVFGRIKKRFTDALFMYHYMGNGGSEFYFPARRGDRFVYALFSLEPVANPQETDIA